MEIFYSSHNIRTSLIFENLSLGNLNNAIEPIENG